jgi:hypothetical protein
MENNKRTDVLLEHYKALRKRFTLQGDRLWLRFYYFLAIESALFGAILTQAPPSKQWLRFAVPVVGLFWTAVWFVIAAGDLWFYEESREKLDAFTSTQIIPLIQGWDEGKEYCTLPPLKRLLCFKISNVGVTTFAPICPLFFLVVWFFALGMRITGR